MQLIEQRHDKLDFITTHRNEYRRVSSKLKLETSFYTLRERPESTRVLKVFLRIARKSILFEQKT